MTQDAQPPREPPPPRPGDTAPRAAPAIRGTSLLTPVEWLGQILGLALAALLHPVGRAALWVFLFLKRQWERIRPPRAGRTPVAAERPPDPLQQPRGEQADGPPDQNARADATKDAAAPAPDDGGSQPVAPAGTQPPGRPPGISWRVGAVYVLVVLCWALLTVMRRVDTALQQMGVGGKPAGSALGFSVSFSHAAESLQVAAAQKAVVATRDAWQGYLTNVASAAGFRSPFGVAQSLVVLDVCFLLLYTALLIVVLVNLNKLNARMSTPGHLDPQPQRRTRVLYGAGGALAVLFFVDLLEDWQIQRALVAGKPLTRLSAQIAVGPLMSLLKVPLTVGVLVAVVFVALSLAVGSVPLGHAFVSIRGVLYAVAGLVLLLMRGIGAAQVEDVIRAWDGWRAAWAVITCFALSLTVAAVARLLSSRAREYPAPDRGRSAQPLLLGGGILLVVVGQVLRAFGRGWGVSVAGALLVALWVLGLPVDGLPRWDPLPAPLRRGPRWLVMSLAAAVGGAVGAALARLVGWALLPGVLLGVIVALAVLAAWTLRAAARPDMPVGVPEGEAEDSEAVAVWGDRLGRVAGSAVAATLVVTIARATALDAYVRATINWEVLRAPLAGAIFAGASGLVVCAYRAQKDGGVLGRAWIGAWVPLTVAALVAGWLLQWGGEAVTRAQAGGSVAVLLGGFLLLTGVLAALAWGVRRGPITQYALAPALRFLRFKRFPVLLFLLAWALVVSVLDSGGYHDIRRAEARPAPAPAPTIGQAWQRYLDAGPPGKGRPVVIVGAQGGGIRAAVWTALVMECIFGPGPVVGSGDICAEGGAEPDLRRLADAADDLVPVFLASGASGGSVGLAAWSARRADLVQDRSSSATPRRIEGILDRDFVAPDVAGLLLNDLPHTLLAWDRTDRAAMLELAWEQAWYNRQLPVLDPSARGLARGLRQTWDLTHANGTWTTPVLALNGISVEDGCRFLASAVDFALPRQLPTDPTGIATAVDSTDDRPDDAACRGVASPPGDAVDILPSTNELIDYLCPAEDVPLSTAAHLSARFPYVSPTGRIERRPCPSSDGLVAAPAVSYDADGGLFDNAGSGTAVDTWRAMVPLAAATERATEGCLVPMFVQIDNSAGRATISSAADPRPNELFAPVGATLGQLSSREAYARAGAATAFGRPVSVGGQPVAIGGVDAVGPMWFRIVLFGQPGPEPPLGWTLAQETVDDMRSQLQAVPNQQQIRTLRRILSSDLTCST